MRASVQERFSMDDAGAAGGAAVGGLPEALAGAAGGVRMVEGNADEAGELLLGVAGGAGRPSVAEDASEKCTPHEHSVCMYKRVKEEMVRAMMGEGQLNVTVNCDGNQFIIDVAVHVGCRTYRNR